MSCLPCLIWPHKCRYGSDTRLRRKVLALDMHSVGIVFRISSGCPVLSPPTRYKRSSRKNPCIGRSSSAPKAEHPLISLLGSIPNRIPNLICPCSFASFYSVFHSETRLIMDTDPVNSFPIRTVMLNLLTTCMTISWAHGTVWRHHSSSLY